MPCWINTSINSINNLGKGLSSRRDQGSRVFTRGSISLIQRFGRSGALGALNLNIHFHMLFLDGVYTDRQDGSAWFHRVDSPTTQELTRLAQTIAWRVERYLERQWNNTGSGLSRSRNAGYPAPPAQTRTCGFPASGSSVVLAIAQDRTIKPTPSGATLQ